MFNEQLLHLIGNKNLFRTPKILKYCACKDSSGVWGRKLLTETSKRGPHHLLKIAIVAILIVLSMQGWSGDAANLFAVFPSGPAAHSLNGFVQAISSAGVFEIYHAAEGFLLLILSIVVLALSMRSRPNSVRICAILGLLAVASAAAGGILFVLSGFQDNGNSAQMGGSFIAAYAFYFIELYYAK